MNRKDLDWWAGVADIVASGLTHGAVRLERVHLSIADETFDVLQQVPITRPWSENIRHAHHGISRLSYRSVSLVASSLGHLARQVTAPKSCKADIK